MSAVEGGGKTWSRELKAKTLVESLGGSELSWWDLMGFWSPR